MEEPKVPTIEIVTPIGKQKVTLKKFINGYDDEAIEAIYTSGRHKVEVEDPRKAKAAAAASAAGIPGAPKAPAQQLEFDGSVIQQAEREGVRRVVLAVDGKSGEGFDPIEAVYSMRKEDTVFVKKAVDAVINPPEETLEKK